MPIDTLINSATGNTIIKSNVNMIGKMVINEPSSTTGSGTDATLLINHATAGGSSSIVFTSATNRGAGADYAYIRYTDNRNDNTTTENSLLTIGVENDAASPNFVHVDNMKLAPAGWLDITGNTNILNTNASSSTTTGALTVGGGVGIAGSVYVGGTITTNNTDINIGSGKLLLRGGGQIYDDGTDLTVASDNDIDIVGNVYVYSNSVKTVWGNMYCGNLLCLANTESSSTLTGSLIVRGGVGIAKQLNIGGRLIISEPGSTRGSDGGTLLIQHGTSGGSSSIRFDSTINRNGGDYAYIQYDDNRDRASTPDTNESALLTIGTSNDGDDDIKIAPSGSLEITGVTKITKDTQSTDNITGSLVVSGGVGIGKRLNVAGDVKFTNTTSSDSTSTGALTVGGGVGIGGRLNAAGDVKFTSSTPSNDNATGALVVTGGVGILGRLNAAGDVKFSTITDSNSTDTGALTVNGGVGIAKQLNIGGRMVISEPGSSSANDYTDAALLLKHGTTGGSSSIVFASSYDTNRGDFSDYGYIRFDDRQTNTAGAQDSLLTIGTTNDAGTGIQDDIKIAPAGSLTITGATKITKDTQSDSTTTGALTVNGGVGVAKDLYVGGKINTGYSTLPTFSPNSIGYTVGTTGTYLTEINSPRNNNHVFIAPTGATFGATLTKTVFATLNRGVYLYTFSAQVNYENATLYLYGETGEDVNRIVYLNMTSTILPGNDSSKGYQLSGSKCFVVPHDSFKIYVIVARFAASTNTTSYSILYNTSAVICRIA